MKIAFPTKPCVFCGESERLVLRPDDVRRWQAGELVQNVWPEMTPEIRELLISGTHGACWDDNMVDEEEEK